MCKTTQIKRLFGKRLLLGLLPLLFSLFSVSPLAHADYISGSYGYTFYQSVGQGATSYSSLGYAQFHETELKQIVGNTTSLGTVGNFVANIQDDDYNHVSRVAFDLNFNLVYLQSPAPISCTVTLPPVTWTITSGTISRAQVTLTNNSLCSNPSNLNGDLSYRVVLYVSGISSQSFNVGFAQDLIQFNWSSSDISSHGYGIRSRVGRPEMTYDDGTSDIVAGISDKLTETNDLLSQQNDLQQENNNAINEGNQQEQDRYDADKQEESDREQAGSDSSQEALGLFNFTVLNPFSGIDVSDGCVTVPTLGSWLHLANSQVCPFFPDGVRAAVSPVIGIFVFFLTFGFLWRLLGTDQTNLEHI